MSDCKERLEQSLRHIVEVLEGYRDDLVMDRDTGKMTDPSALDEDDIIDLKEYLTDTLGIHFVVDGDCGYRAVIITMTSGGPGIWLDTWEMCVRGLWGPDRAEVPLTAPLAEMVDTEMRYEYEMRRGSR